MFLYLNQGQLLSFFLCVFVFLPTASQFCWDNLECKAEKRQWEKSWEHWCGTTYTSSYQCDSAVVMEPLCSPALEQRWSWIRCWEAQLHKQKAAQLSAAIMWQSHITLFSDFLFVLFLFFHLVALCYSRVCLSVRNPGRTATFVSQIIAKTTWIKGFSGVSLNLRFGYNWVCEYFSTFLASSSIIVAYSLVHSFMKDRAT